MSDKLDHSSAIGEQAVRRALRLRLLSALVLIPPVLIAVWTGGRLFTSLVTFAAMLMVFEWTRMVERRAYSWRFYLLAGTAASALILSGMGAFSTAFIICAMSMVVVLIPFERDWRAGLWPGLSVPYIILPSIGLIWLRFDPENGRSLTMLIFATVWAADTGAFVTGKLVGGPKISYALSPSKTWSGIAGGVLGGAAIGAGFAALLFGPKTALAFALPGGFLGAASVAGDLAESAFKRKFGVKDISGLIPGHGGVLDRLDGMIFATSAMTSVYLLYMVSG